MVLITALNIMLYLYTGQQDIRIGILVANRLRKESEGVIGHFVNTVIIRTTVLPQMTFNELLKQVRKVTLSAYAHQELPFDHLVQTLEELRKIDRASLFQVMLIYNNVRSESLECSGLYFCSPRHEANRS